MPIEDIKDIEYTDAMEMGRLDEREDREDQPQEQKQEETNINDNWRDENIVVIDTSNPDSKTNKIWGSDKIPNPKKDVGVNRRAYTEDNKSLLRELGFTELKF